MNNHDSRPVGGGFRVRWRGRVEESLSLEEIEARLENSQLSMLSQIEIGEGWMTLRQFFQELKVSQETTPIGAASPSTPKPPGLPPLSIPVPKRKVTTEAAGLPSPKRHQFAVFGAALLCTAVIAALLTGGRFGFTKAKSVF